MKRHRVTLHLVQFSSVSGEPLKTLHRLQTLLEGFTPGRGEWLILPEMWPSGFNMQHIKQQLVENAFCIHWLKDYARKKHCYLSGSMLEMPKKRAYNSAFLITPDGKLLARYRKIHLFPLTQEHIKYNSGKNISVSKLPWGKSGMAICFDLRFPELFRRMTQRGAKLVVVPSAWPKERIDHMLTLLKARAIENQCFMVGVNKTGKEKEGMVYGGHSVVFGPWGDKLGEMGTQKGILSVSIDLSEVDQIRNRYPFLKSRVFRQ